MPTQDLILSADLNGVRTLTMNNPKRLNGWTQGMMSALKKEFKNAATDDAVKVLVLLRLKKRHFQRPLQSSVSPAKDALACSLNV